MLYIAAEISKWREEGAELTFIPVAVGCTSVSTIEGDPQESHTPTAISVEYTEHEVNNSKCRDLVQDFFSLTDLSLRGASDNRSP